MSAGSFQKLGSEYLYVAITWTREAVRQPIKSLTRAPFTGKTSDVS